MNKVANPRVICTCPWAICMYKNHVILFIFKNHSLKRYWKHLEWLKLTMYDEISTRFKLQSNFYLLGLSAFALKLYRYKNRVLFKCLRLWNRFSPEFTWDLLLKRYCQFVQMVLHYWTRCPPCPYMVKTLTLFSRSRDLGILYRGHNVYQISSNYVCA